MLLAAVSLAAGLTACGDDDDAGGAAGPGDAGGGVSIEHAWVRQPAAGQTNAAAYGVVINGTEDEVTLVGASTDSVDVESIQLHETLMDDEGTMSMQEREGGFAIPAGESLTLEPGGAHVMMIGVDPADFTGDIDLTFEFDGADPVTVSAELREIGTEADEMPMDSEMDM
jgi:copper(I)-binding protein